MDLKFWKYFLFLKYFSIFFRYIPRGVINWKMRAHEHVSLFLTPLICTLKNSEKYFQHFYKYILIKQFAPVVDAWFRFFHITTPTPWPYNDPPPWPWMCHFVYCNDLPRLSFTLSNSCRFLLSMSFVMSIGMKNGSPLFFALSSNKFCFNRL